MAFKFSENQRVFDITIVPEDLRVAFEETTGYYESFPEDDDNTPHNKWQEWRIKEDMWPLVVKYESMQVELEKLRQYKDEVSHNIMRKGIEDRLTGKTQCKVFDNMIFKGQYKKQAIS